MPAPLRFRLLGSFEVTRGSIPVEVSSNKLRVVLATLLLAAGRTVSIDTLIDRLWGPEPPDGARSTLQVHVMRLRRALGAGQPIRTMPGGYSIVVDPAHVDVSTFHGLLRESRSAQGPADEEELLAAALSLWRGPALLGVESDNLHEAEVPLLVEERLRAVERRAEIALSSGRYAAVMGDLTTVVHEHPLRERPWAQLIELLHRSGRRAEALDAYQRMYRLFRDELGIGPGDRIRQLHDAILAEDADLDVDAEQRTRRSVVPLVQPAQLPANPGPFVGRGDELLRLVGRLAEPTSATQVVVISGAPGIGKTALALRAAHSLRSRFPDGQLHVDLRGHATAEPLPPAVVLQRFLRALGVPTDAVPHDADECAGLYRSVLAERKVLVVLDNAACAQQVRPLLPGSSASAAVITSRNTLHELTVAGAGSMVLHPLGEPEACELLAAVAGQARADPLAARDLAGACGGLPLALRIAGASLDANPHQPLPGYTAELRCRGVAHLSVGGGAEVAVRSAFDLSYERLPSDVAELFGWLGAAPGSDFSAAAVAAIAGTDDPTSARRIDVLVAANLAYPTGASRYRIHDLLRRYAADRAADAPQRTAAAVGRLLDYYLHSTRNAVLVLAPQLRAPAVAAPGAGVRPNRPATEELARSWIDAELPNLVAAALIASGPAGAVHTGRLAELLRHHVAASGVRLDQLTAFDASLHVAQQSPGHPAPSAEPTTPALTTFVLERYRKAIDHRADDRAEAAGHPDDTGTGPAATSTPAGAGDPATATLHGNHRGFNAFVAGRPDLALAWHREALDEARAIGDRRGTVQAYNGLGMASWATGRLTAAIRAHERAVRLAAEDRDEHVRGFSLLWLAVARTAAGDYEQAVADAEAGIEIGWAVDEPRHEIMGQVVRADAVTRSGRPGAVIADLLAARQRAESIDFRPGLTPLLIHLAEAQRATGDPESALAGAERARTLARDGGTRIMEAMASIEVGRCQIALDRPHHAADVLRRALSDAKAGRMRLLEAKAWHGCGLVAVALSEDAEARRCWRRARQLYAAAGAPEAAQVELQLVVADGLPPGSRSRR